MLPRPPGTEAAAVVDLRVDLSTPQPEAGWGDAACAVETRVPTGPQTGSPGGPPGGSPTDRLRFLDTATRRIARGLDLDETLRALRLSAVPAFADAILVHLCDPLPAGDNRSASPATLRLYRREQSPSAPDTPLGGVAATATAERLTVPDSLAAVLSAGRPVFGDAPGIASSVPALLAQPAAAAAPQGRRLIIAPLYGRHRSLGVVVLLRGPDRPVFDPDDLLVASQLATHAALGLDKAALYGREASVADALQRAMLPSSLPEPAGVRLASRYLPSSETARVGGDWYDAIPLPGNRVALVVGDVMGHSMTSAAIMGQLRTTVQTLAGLDLPPEEVLHHLDEQAQRLGSEHMATCLYAIYDPVSHRLLVANAGHPPPVLLLPDGRTEVLWIPPGAPIGVGGVPFESVELPAPVGATLLLYTDGLVESRERDVWTGVELLCDRLHTASARLAAPHPDSSGLEDLCDQVLGTLGPGTRDDDIALLAARFDGIPSRDVAYWFLDPRPQTAERARRLTRRTLRRWGLDPMLDSTELMVSEVVTNAVRFASRPITLRLLRTDILRCEVADDSPKVPRMRHAQPGDEGGRGLFLVDWLAERWGATRLSTGKVVWFEQQIPDQQRGRTPPGS